MSLPAPTTLSLYAKRSRVLGWLVAAAWFISGIATKSVQAQPTGFWQASEPDVIDLPQVTFNGTGYLEVRLRFDQLLSHQVAPVADRTNVLDAQTGLLTLREVVVGDRTYWNVVVRPTALLSLGGASRVAGSRVKVVGDSLSDSGTFGYKFTVQGTPLIPVQIWTDWVAAGLGAPALCPRYTAVAELEVALNSSPSSQGCTSLAVGGGRIHPLGVLGQSFRNQPFSITRQLQDMALLHPYEPQDVLLLSVGGNDLADLLTLFLDDSTEGVLKYVLYLNELLPTSQVWSASTGGRQARIQAGHALMQALANRLADHLLTEVWGKGAQKVVLLNAPNVARTPRFRAMLDRRGDAVELAQTTAAWADSFNNRLANRLADRQSGLITMDFRQQLDNWVSAPTHFGLTNGTDPACPITGTDSAGLPDFDLARCTPTNAIDAGRNHVFADAFHGTPSVQKQLANEVLRAMAQRGWR